VRDRGRVEPAGPRSARRLLLLAAVRQAERIRAISRERTGRLLAEMHARGKSWPQIARETGIRQTTAYGWAQPYLAPEGEDER
jgi:hypothetical protein